MATTRKTTTSTGNTSRKPRTAARAASRPATRRAVAEPEPDVEPIDDEVSAAEAQEIEADGYVTALLCGEEVQVLPPSMWRVSYQQLLNMGRVYEFAAKVLHPDDYEFFVDLDPTTEEFQDFVQEAGDRSGEPVGKSRARSRSGGRMRRR